MLHEPNVTVMVALNSLMSELVNATIKFGMAPLEVGPELAANFKVQLVDNLLNSLTAKLFRREQNSYFLVGTYSIFT